MGKALRMLQQALFVGIGLTKSLTSGGSKEYDAVAGQRFQSAREIEYDGV
jgi:hypothetical protein